MFLFNDTLNTFYLRLYGVRHMVKDQSDSHIGYSFQLTARVLLYAPSHRQDSTYHSLCYTSRGALVGTRTSSMGPPHEGSIRRPIAPRANALLMRKSVYLHGFGGLPMSDVDLADVLEQQPLALEGFVAHVAHVGRELLVHELDVRHEVGLVVEAAAAVAALVRFLAGVDEHVAVDVVLLGEALLAHAADEDLLVGRLPALVHALRVTNQGSCVDGTEGRKCFYLTTH